MFDKAILVVGGVISSTEGTTVILGGSIWSYREKSAEIRLRTANTEAMYAVPSKRKEIVIADNKEEAVSSDKPSKSVTTTNEADKATEKATSVDDSDTSEFRDPNNYAFYAEILKA